MNFSEIETFLMIVQTKNITKTSENLYLSQPTVSHRLKSLEDELNTKLVVRKKGHKTIELTPKGEEFISKMDDFVERDADAAEWTGKSSADGRMY